MKALGALLVTSLVVVFVGYGVSLFALLNGSDAPHFQCELLNSEFCFERLQHQGDINNEF